MDTDWVHYCPNATTTAPRTSKVGRTRGEQPAADPHVAASNAFIAAANPLLVEARASDDRLRELLDRYNAEFIPLVTEVAKGLTSDEAARMHVAVELLREQRKQTERMRELWGLARGLLAAADLVDALESGT